MRDISQARLFRTDTYTHVDKKTGKIDRQIACYVYVFKDWSYELVFEQIV